jgi:hypothetical protein
LELFVSSVMRWMADEEPGAMDRVIADQLALLRSQMPSGKRQAEKDQASRNQAPVEIA